MKILTADKIRSLLDYDERTGLFFRRGGSKSLGSLTSDGYLEFSVDGRVYKAHRLAWLFMKGRWPLSRMDHIDGNRTNNAIKNLREADGQQNAANRRVLSHLGTKGVYRRGNRFIAGIKINGRRHHLGSFKNLSDATAAYSNAARKAFGEFAWIAPDIVGEGR
jgi:hypothetical protein